SSVSARASSASASPAASRSPAESSSPCPRARAACPFPGSRLRFLSSYSSGRWAAWPFSSLSPGIWTPITYRFSGAISLDGRPAPFHDIIRASRYSYPGYYGAQSRQPPTLVVRLPSWSTRAPYPALDCSARARPHLLVRVFRAPVSNQGAHRPRGHSSRKPLPRRSQSLVRRAQPLLVRTLALLDFRRLARDDDRHLDRHDRIRRRVP